MKFHEIARNLLNRSDELKASEYVYNWDIARGIEMAVADLRNAEEIKGMGKFRGKDLETAFSPSKHKGIRYTSSPPE